MLLYTEYNYCTGIMPRTKVLLNENGVDRVNTKEKELTETIERLRNRLDDKDDLLRKQLAISQNLDKQLRVKEKEIVDIKRTLDDMIANERTHLGHNALLNFKEMIQ